jgi:hypothetical protein
VVNAAIHMRTTWKWNGFVAMDAGNGIMVNALTYLQALLMMNSLCEYCMKCAGNAVAQSDEDEDEDENENDDEGEQ